MGLLFGYTYLEPEVQMPLEAWFMIAIVVLWAIILPRPRKGDGFDNAEARELHVRERRDGADD